VRWWLPAAALGAWTLGTHVALAGQGTDWNGPPCRFEAATFVACSQEPPVSLDPMPCYVSKLANYVPDRVELGMIALCQAAKAALGAPPDQRSNEVLAVESRGVDLAVAIREDPEDAAQHSDAIHTIGGDLVKLSGRIAAYGLSGSPDEDDPVSNTLLDLTTDAQVWAGTD
jgi:hypothetical protein